MYIRNIKRTLNHELLLKEVDRVIKLNQNDSNGIRTNNHLVRKQTLKNLTKLVNWIQCSFTN